MKDVYELLNDVDVDLSQYEEVDLSDIEKKRIKKRLHQNLKVSSIPKVSKAVAAGLCILVISGFTLVKTAPTFAVGIPVVGDIIKHMTGYDYAEFDKYTSVINKAVDKSGINATLNEVMLDENQLRIATTFKSNEKLKDRIIFASCPKVYVNGKLLKVSAGGTKQPIDEYSYLTVDSLNVHDEKIPTNISMRVVYDEIIFVNQNGTDDKRVAGPWEFEFNSSKSEIEKNTKVIKLNKNVAIGDVKVELKNLSITPLTTNLSFNFTGKLPVSFIIKDDKGNVLRGEGSGYGTGGPVEIIKNQYKAYESFSAVSKEAKKLYITPYFNNGNTKDGKGKFANTEPIKWNNETVTLKQDANNKIIISKIQRKDGKIYVDYKTEGISITLQEGRLYLYNGSKEQLDRIYEDDNMKEIVNSNDTLHAVFKDKGGSDIYLGTDNMADISIMKDSEFTVDLK